MTHYSPSNPKPIVFPRNLNYLSNLGTNIRLAMQRRNISIQLMHDRTGIPILLIDRILAGDPTITIGHYINVLAVVGLAKDLELVAADEVLISKLSEIERLSLND